MGDTSLYMKIMKKISVILFIAFFFFGTTFSAPTMTPDAVVPEEALQTTKVCRGFVVKVATMGKTHPAHGDMVGKTSPVQSSGSVSCKDACGSSDNLSFHTINGVITSRTDHG